MLNGIEAKNDLPDSDELSNHVTELKDQLIKERYDYIVSYIAPIYTIHKDGKDGNAGCIAGLNGPGWIDPKTDLCPPL